MDALPDGRQRYLFQVLSELIHYIGKRSLGDRHLVEIMDPAQLKKIKLKGIGNRLIEARRALHVIRSFTGDRCLPDLALGELTRIKPMPKSPTDTIRK